MSIAPEYYEHARLRDVFIRDVAAITAMIETLAAQRRLLTRVTSREATTKAFYRLDAAATELSDLRAQLNREIDEHTAAMAA